MNKSFWIESDNMKVKPEGFLSQATVHAGGELTGRVVVDTLAAFNGDNLNRHATIMVDGPANGKKIRQALSLATQGDNERPLTVNVSSVDDGLFVDGKPAEVYHETIPMSLMLVILDDQG